MNIHDRIRAAREKARLSLTEVAQQLGVSRQAADDWEKKAVPRRERLQQFAQLTGVDVDWLLTGNSASLALGDKYVFIRRYVPTRTDPGSPAVAAHVSITAFANDDDTYAFRRDWIARRGLSEKALTVVLAPDALMAPTFQQADPLLVNTDDVLLTDNAVYAFEHAGAVFVRRCFARLDGQLALHVDSGSRPDEVVARDALTVIGRIVTASITL